MISIITILMLVALPQNALAFFRTQSTTPTLEEPYSIHGPSINLTRSQVQGNNMPVNSFWYASYLTGENGHEYFTVACHSYSTNTSVINSYASIMDITTKEYFGINNVVPGVIPNTTYDIEGGGLRMYASSPDLVSVQHAESVIPGASYNLTYVPLGPALYHGASGIHYWGSGTTTQLAYPQLLVTGTITVNNTHVPIVPEKSVSWFDRQWGLDSAYNGWYFFNIFLEEGLIIAVWVTFPVAETPKISSFGTVVFPDGHTETHVVDPDVRATDSFVSPITNNTYYSNYKLSFPTLHLVLDANLPVKEGEMYDRENPAVATSLFESYVDYNGTLNGKATKGFGLVEQVYAIF